MKSYKILLTGILSAGLIFIFGCSGFLPEKLGFGKFPQYKNFGKNVTAIEVNWDTGNSAPTVFAIKNTDEINKIINMYKNTVFIKAKNVNADGNNHSYLNFIGEESNTTISLWKILYGDTKQNYKYPDAKIFNRIRQIGIDAGVLNN